MSERPSLRLAYDNPLRSRQRTRRSKVERKAENLAKHLEELYELNPIMAEAFKRCVDDCLVKAKRRAKRGTR